MDDRGSDAEDDRPDPHGVVRTRRVIDPTSQPYPEETSHLVTEEDEPVEGG